MEYVGIDLHKKESQICLLTETGEVIERRIRTEPQRFAEVLGGRPRARILVEASTESEWVARCLEALGASTSTRTSAASTPVRHAENTRASITRPGHPTCGSLKREDPTGPLPAQAPRPPHPPLRGSRSGRPALEVEGVPEVPHAGHAAGLVQRHADHVEAAGALAEAAGPQVAPRQAAEPRSLARIHRGLGWVARATPTGLDLHENQRRLIARDQVDLAKPGAQVAGENDQALPLEETDGRVLTLPPERSCRRSGRVLRRSHGHRQARTRPSRARLLASAVGAPGRRARCHTGETPRVRTSAPAGSGPAGSPKTPHARSNPTATAATLKTAARSAANSLHRNASVRTRRRIAANGGHQAPHRATLRQRSRHRKASDSRRRSSMSTPRGVMPGA